MIKEKIDSKLQEIEGRIAQATINYNELISKLEEQKFMLTMATESKIEINSKEDLETYIAEKEIIEGGE